MEQEQEEWRPVVGYEGLYEVSSFGRVKSVKRFVNSRWNKPRIVNEKIRVACISPTTLYPCVMLCSHGNTKTKSIHRLVASAFLPNPTNLPVINHKDGTRNNNHVSNLEWCTQSHNAKHACAMGTQKSPRYWKDKHGKEHHQSKPTYVYSKNKVLLGIYESARDAALAHKVEAKNVRSVCKGTRHTCGGLIFSYTKLSAAI